MFVKLELPLLRVCEVPLNVTVFPRPGLKVPDVFDQLPSMVNEPDGALSVPPLNETTPLTTTAPLEPVNVPPETFNPSVVSIPLIVSEPGDVGAVSRPVEDTLTLPLTTTVLV